MAYKQLKIIKASSEPSPNNLWLHKGQLKKYSGRWDTISSAVQTQQPQGIVLVNGMHFKNSSMTQCPDIDTSRLTSYAYLFYGCSLLEQLPKLDFKNIDSISYMCFNCSNLTTFPELDYSNIKKLDYAFYQCSSIQDFTAPKLSPETSSLNGTFYGCNFVTDEWFKSFDFSNVKELSETFKTCTNLTSVELDCSKITSLDRTFSNCTKLSNIKLYNTQNVTTFYGAFTATAITKVPDIDTSNAVDIGTMFALTNIVEIPPLDTSKVETFNSLLNGCKKITKIHQLDFSSAKSINDWCNYNNTLLKYIKIINLGKSELTTYKSFAANWGTGSEENRQSVIDTLIVYSYDRAANNMPTATVTLSTNTKALLTEEELVQITQKGYTVA